MNHLETLNEEQKKAVLATEGPVLIVAGAGAGKTKTITHRIMHLIINGVSPERILAITFTNKAAKEMRERVFGLLDSQRSLLTGAVHLSHFDYKTLKVLQSDNITSHLKTQNPQGRTLGSPFVSTFHAFGVQIIKENAELLKLPRHFNIFDKADSKKALKDALVSLGIDPKEHLEKIQHIISGEKGRGVDIKEYSERESFDYTSELTKKAWTKYEETMRHEHALDFDDLLLKTLKILKKYPDVLERYQDRFFYIHIDEYQDTNKVQNEIVDLIAKKHKNICVVGDTDQCLVGGTKIQMADNSLKSIEDIKKGELVLSNYGSGDFRPARITSKKTKRFKGDLIQIETKNGRVLKSTPEHIHFAGYRLGLTPQIYLNYLMYKKDFGWRIGTTSIYTKGQKKSVVGFIQRSNQEHADSTWIVSTHKTQKDALVQEYVLSLKYQIPTIPFTPRKRLGANGYVHDGIALKEIFSSFDTEKSAQRLLSDLGFLRNHPHHQPQTHNSNRRNINVTLCADRRGKTPMHLISTFGNDSDGRKKLESLGFSVRSAKKGTKNWRFETANADYGKICLLSTKIASIFPETNLVFSARLGGMKTNPRDSNSLPCLPASSIMPGMALFTPDGYDIVTKISRIPTSKIKVFDLDIERTHNFIANNILTHNCIYSWRGAEIKNMLHFEKTYPEVKTFFLEQNYRSTKNILAVANKIIEKNIFRIPKKLFTENLEGEKIGLFKGRSEVDEAHFIAMKSKELISKGVVDEDIAVLYRANFQSRVLEDAFLSHGVPYQMLGTKFFERKEIKDVVSFVKASLNTENLSDFVRIINIPPRGIGKTTVQKIIQGLENGLPENTKAKINNFRKMLNDFRGVLTTQKPSDALKFIIKTSGIENMYGTGTEEDTERLENIMELVSLAREYDDLKNVPDSTEAPLRDSEYAIEKFLTDAALVSDQDALDGEKKGVKLMTVHSSKGLEFDYVFISGLEADLFPHRKKNEGKKSGEDKEEERRLFYVAITRAGKKLFLTHAETRTIFGATEINSPSEFIDDIPEKYLEKELFPGESYKKPLFSIDF